MINTGFEKVIFGDGWKANKLFFLNVGLNLFIS